MPPASLAGLNLNLLVALDALLSEQSVTNAATVIGITQPAMSHSLAKLRDLFEDKLLIRSPTGLQLTPLAMRIRPDLRRCLEDLERTIWEREQFDAASSVHEFTIATADYLAASLGRFLVPALEQAPGVSIRMRRLEVPQLKELLRSESVDLAIGPAVTTPSDIESTPFHRERFVCAVRREHPLAPARRLSLKRYCALSHIQVSPTGRGQSSLDSALRTAGASRRVVLRCESFIAAMTIAMESDLAVTVPEAALTGGSFRTTLRHFDLPVAIEPLSLRLYWHARRSGQPNLSWLRLQVEEARGNLVA